MTLPSKDSHASRHIKTHLESFINHSSSEGNRELNGSLSYGISTLVASTLTPDTNFTASSASSQKNISTLFARVSEEILRESAQLPPGSL